MPAQPHTRLTTGLTLVPARPQKHSPLALWHLLSLDAPTVAALWTSFVARSCNIQLPWTSPTAMFLAVWMLYAADRLLDARHASQNHLEERHRFHDRHHTAFRVGIVLASIGLAILLPSIQPATLRIYAVLASLLGAYFFIIHIHSPTNAHRLPKELAVGLFFPAAVFIPTISRAPQLRLALIPCALLFAATCTLNCLYLYAWEHRAPRLSAHWTTRFATNHLPELTIALVCLSSIPSGNLLLRTAATLSAILLLVLHHQRHRLTRIHLRAAADLALLTPILLLPFTR